MPVVTAPEEIGNAADSYMTVFLAGAIDMGAAVDWQAQVIEKIGDKFCIFNPRRENFTPDTLDEQIEWELDKLERADYIFLWFPKDSKAPISFFEAGLYWQSSKLIVGAEPGFYRRRNLEITAERYNVMLADSLDRMIMRLLTMNARSAYPGDLFIVRDPDRQCEADGCDQPAENLCNHPDGPVWLCDRHAIWAGYCPRCLKWFAGDEDAELDLRQYGMCAHCWDDEVICLPDPDPCPDCGGAGTENESGETCPTCKGAGEVYPKPVE